MLTDEFGALAGAVWRRKALVVLVTLLFGAAAWYSVRDEPTVYTSSAALTVSSANRAPEQDAILSQGYAAFFNDALFQGRLREQAGVPDGVSFEATTGLASPLLYVTASSTNRRDVETAARTMADALRTEVNQAIQGTRMQAVEDLKAAFEDLRATTDPVPDQVLVDLNDRIGDITADSSNKLEPVQLNSFVQAEEPATAMTLALGFGGGLFVGCVLAVLLGAVSRRIESAAQAERRTELAVVAEVPFSPDAVTDAQLWFVLRAERDGPGALERDMRGRTSEDATPTVVAVTCARQHGNGPDIARRLAVAASRTGRTVLVDLRDQTADQRRGLTDYVAKAGLRAPQVIQRGTESLSIVSRGSVPMDLYAALVDPRGLELFEALRQSYDTIVLASPGMLDSADAMSVCGLADDVLLVVEEGRSRTRDLVQSAHLLTAVAAHQIQLVMIQRETALRRRRSRRTSTSEAGVALVDDTPVKAQLSRVP